ncbi:MAG: hypothetical protein NTZ33_04970 [Bacteroidetes bacterium]|nr:hypothetical protein [Bacteroidota bacterium]
MKTKNLILNMCLLLIIFIFSMQLNAQNGQRRQIIKDKVEAQKVAYITNALSLTAAEAQQFWPVYNEYSAKNEELLKTFRKNNIEDRNVDPEKITDKEAMDMADDQIIQAQKILDLRKKYHIEFKKVLPPKKLLKLYQAEKDFKKFLLKEIKDRRDDRMKR